MSWLNNLREKLNPAQSLISGGGGIESSEGNLTNYTKAYEQIEVVNRGVNMLVDDIAEIPFQVGESLPGAIATGIKKKTLERLLNERPNPFQDISTFKRNLFIDYIVDGNIFIYFDGVHLYHLPATKVQIHKSEKNYIAKFTYNNVVDYSPEEVIHVKENSFDSIYRGESRLKSALGSMDLVMKMKAFQTNFFKNGAVPGLVLESPNTLSSTVKDRMIANWQKLYNPTSGGRRPLILDGGLKVNKLSTVDFKELDFDQSITSLESRILKVIGVPPLLLDSGNNANIRPNMRLYYLETVLPVLKKFSTAMQFYFGYKITENITGVQSLQPELRELASYYSSLVNGGIITPNEARRPLGLENLPEGGDEIRIPANIAGSAANPDEGGRPTEDNGDGTKS